MNPNIGIFIAFLAGILSFLSPCILPLIPSYLSYIGGVSYRELSERRATRMGIFLKTVFFVLGFTLVFSTLGLLFGGGGGLLLGGATQILNIIAGAVVMVLGLNFIFDFWKFLNIERRFHLQAKPVGAAGALLLGMAFGGGWTPCVGPILASILFLAGSKGKALQGTLLLSFYSLGLGLPFLLAGLFFSRFMKQADKIKPHLHKIKIASGFFLILIGVFILLGRMQQLNIYLFSLAGSLNAWKQSNPWQPQILFGILFILPTLLLGYAYFKKTAHEKRYQPAPIRFALGFFFLLLSVLTFSGLIDPTRFFTFWFAFQGI